MSSIAPLKKPNPNHNHGYRFSTKSPFSRILFSLSLYNCKHSLTITLFPIYDPLSIRFVRNNDWSVVWSALNPPSRTLLWSTASSFGTGTVRSYCFRDKAPSYHGSQWDNRFVWLLDVPGGESSRLQFRSNMLTFLVWRAKGEEDLPARVAIIIELDNVEEEVPLSRSDHQIQRIQHRHSLLSYLRTKGLVVQEHLLMEGES